MKKSFIILAEDNPDHADLVKLAFTSIGLERDIIHLTNGVEVIDFLNNNANNFPDLILLDINMPKLSGLEVLKQIKSKDAHKKIPVIILTSSEDKNDINKAYDGYANSYLKKPIDFNGLKEVLTDVKDYWLDLNKSPLYTN